MRPWSQEEIFHDGDKFFTKLRKAVVHAKETIDVETYIFSDDELGREVISLLNDAASRGIRVRLIVDGIGSSARSIQFLMFNLHQSVEARVYNPLPWMVTRGLAKTPSLRSWARRILGINRRNHRKTWIIDGHTAFVGSMNVSLDHFAWRDTAVMISGPGVSTVSLAFEKTWHKAGRALANGHARRLQGRHHRFLKSKLRRHKNVLVRLNDTWRMRRRGFRELLARIEKAQDKVWITNAYFVPHASLVKALCRAATRGVDVRIVVPRRCDVIFIPWVRSVFYNTLLKSGVRIFEYLPRMLHAKTMIIDNWAIVGSSNLNHRSLHHDLEVDVVLTRDETYRSLARRFLADIRESSEVMLDDYVRRPLYLTGPAQALALLKNWM